jgi:hypothetical protein
MPDSWDAEIYRARAMQWRERAEKLPKGEERDTCLVIAEGYANLAALIEKTDPVAISR